MAESTVVKGVEEVVRCNELRKQDFRCFDE